MELCFTGKKEIPCKHGLIYHYFSLSLLSSFCSFSILYFFEFHFTLFNVMIGILFGKAIYLILIWVGFLRVDFAGTGG